MNSRELATVLAALRYFQEKHPYASDAEICFPDYFADVSPLSMDEIDELCERLNCGEVERPAPTLTTKQRAEDNVEYVRTTDRIVKQQDNED